MHATPTPSAHLLSPSRPQCTSLSSLSSRLGILYDSFRPQYYYFEPVELSFKLLLGLAVVLSNDEQIRNAALASLFMFCVMVRVGVRPSRKGWKDQAEVVALGFSLVLKLHDMVHSYLTASKENAIDKKQEDEWQAIIDESDSFLVGLFVALFVFGVLRVSALRVLEGCRQCLRKICGRKCTCLEIATGNGGSGRETVLEMYSNYDANGSGTAHLKHGERKTDSGSGSSLDDDNRVSLGQPTAVGGGSGGGSVGSGSDGRASSGGIFMHDNPIFRESLRAKEGQKVRTQSSETRDQKEYEVAHKKHLLKWQNTKSRRKFWSSGLSITPAASFVQDLVTTVQQEEDEQHGGSEETHQGGGPTRRRVVDAWSEHCDEDTLKVLYEMVVKALKQRAGEEKTNTRSMEVEAKAAATGASRRRQGRMVSHASSTITEEEIGFGVTSEHEPLAAVGADSLGIIIEGGGSSSAPGPGTMSNNSLWDPVDTVGRESVADGRCGESALGSASGARIPSSASGQSGPASPAEGKDDGQQEASRPATNSAVYVEL